MQYKNIFEIYLLINIEIYLNFFEYFSEKKRIKKAQLFLLTNKFLGFCEWIFFLLMFGLLL
jgi:hypothetical protein